MGAAYKKKGEFIYNGVIFSKKNSKNIIINRRTGSPQIVSNQRAKAMEADMAEQFAFQALHQGWRIDESMEYDIFIRIFPKDRTRRDLDNQATSILDALVAAAVLPDDSSKYVKALHVYCMRIDRKEPRAHVVIKAMDRED